MLPGTLSSVINSGDSDVVATITTAVLLVTEVY